MHAWWVTGRISGFGAICCSALLLLTGCASKESPMPEAGASPPPERSRAVGEDERSRSVAEAYNLAMDKLEAEEYSKAQGLFEDVEREYPYSPWAVRAQVMAAFCAYQQRDYEQAVTMLERFVQLYPGNSLASYAYYLISLSYYAQIADVTRDQGNTERAGKALGDVIARFPDSDYARDAKVRLDLVHNHLAGKEMEIGRYYLSKEKYVGAISRFNRVLEAYNRTAHVPEALYRLTEAYVALGVLPEAKKYAAVLGHNFPDSDWYKRAFDLLGEYGIEVKAAS